MFIMFVNGQRKRKSKKLSDEINLYHGSYFISRKPMFPCQVHVHVYDGDVEA